MLLLALGRALGGGGTDGAFAIAPPSRGARRGDDGTDGMAEVGAEVIAEDGGVQAVGESAEDQTESNAAWSSLPLRTARPPIPDDDKPAASPSAWAGCARR